MRKTSDCAGIPNLHEVNDVYETTSAGGIEGVEGARVNVEGGKERDGGTVVKDSDFKLGCWSVGVRSLPRPLRIKIENVTVCALEERCTSDLCRCQDGRRATRRSLTGR